MTVAFSIVVQVTPAIHRSHASIVRPSITSAVAPRVVARQTKMSLIPSSEPDDDNSSALRILITGSTKGVGRALAETFLSHNDTVIVTSRYEDNVQDAIISIRNRMPSAQVFGYVADVRHSEDVHKLLTFANETFGTVHAVICNAGTTGTRAPLEIVNYDQLQSVVETNLLGPMYCAQHAMRIARLQTSPLHVFLMDGSGTIGNATPQYAAYGATKRTIPQLAKTLNAEPGPSNIRFHVLSPGMVLTDLLLTGNTTQRSRTIFNFLAEEPDTVSANLVPRIRATIQGDHRKRYLRFLTIPNALIQMAAGFLFGVRKNKFFDETSGARIDTNANYNENGVRLRE